MNFSDRIALLNHACSALRRIGHSYSATLNADTAGRVTARPRYVLWVERYQWTTEKRGVSHSVSGGSVGTIMGRGCVSLARSVVRNAKRTCGATLRFDTLRYSMKLIPFPGRRVVAAIKIQIRTVFLLTVARTLPGLLHWSACLSSSYPSLTHVHLPSSKSCFTNPYKRQ